MHEFPARFLHNGQSAYITLAVPKNSPLDAPVVVSHDVDWPHVGDTYASRVVRNARHSFLNRLLADGLMTKDQEMQYRRC